MQKEVFYGEPTAVFRRTNMLVNLEIDEKIHLKSSSSLIKEDLPPWTFFLISGQHKDRCLDSMQYYCSGSETVEDWQFLCAAEKDVVDHFANETINQLPTQKLDDNNDVKNNLKEKRLMCMDGNYTQAVSRRPADDVEMFEDENTGETIVKLWQCLYPIDIKCKLSSGMGFSEEADQPEFETKCTSGYETGDKMLTDTNSQQGNNWATVNSIESMNESQPFAFTKCKMETDDPATNDTKSNKPFEEIRRSVTDPCLKNTSMKRVNYSCPLLTDQSYNFTIRNANGQSSCCENTQVAEQSSQYFFPNSNSTADYDYLYDTYHTSENSHVYRKENTGFYFASRDDTNPPTGTLFPGQYNHTLTQANMINNSSQTFKNMPEPISRLEDGKFKTQMQSYASSEAPQNKVQNKSKFDVKGSPALVSHNEPHSLENVGFKAKKLKRGCRLWEYIRNLLLDPRTNPSLIKWEDRKEGTFKLVQNKKIAFDWGWKKGNSDMSYEKLSRAMRYYYKKKIFQPVIGKRLVYKFGPNATGWKDDIKPS
ncbi:uncharacterized protein LOC132728338 isoform X2 [Ruditapes philippinarum]|uniref:uncharacterized protein LOC132728338 isoform X2 n=1 Tax=Ruditapes philippinarum TaxID=129788 RepID=UPI00295ADC5B|nr:uncharacterized protein LOC132728338 isoform X2 [Ruditapes philippinarum]